MSVGNRWDVFLSHSHADHAAVGVIAQRLRDESGLRPFLDRWHLLPGQPWQGELADALDDSATAAVFIGPTGMAPWHNQELQVALNRAVAASDEFRVIPVLLPGVDATDLPDFLALRTWVDFRPGLDDDGALQRLAAAVRGEAIAGDGYELPDEPAPYRGLQRFESDAAHLFFGRTSETADLLERVSARRFVAVVGASGSGKSSLVRAGLLPQLRANAAAGSDQWRQLVCTPGSDPFRALARQVATLTHGPHRLSLIDELTARFTHRRGGLASAIADLVADDRQPVLLVVDQFEELFTLCPHDDAAKCRGTADAFVATLAEAVTDPAGGVRVVITLRADFLGSALQLPRLNELLADPVLLGPLGDTALREVIAGPAQAVGAFFEKGLMATILRDVHDQQGALPLLQHALLELWHRRRGPWLTIDAYEEIGGVGGALARRADTTYASLLPHQRHLARMVLLRLIALGEGVADTRRRVGRGELYPAGVDPREVDAVIQTLSAERARLVVADEHSVEITHETLLREWGMLRDWLDTNREAQRVHRRLTYAAVEWAGPLERDSGALYRGAQLAEAEEWAADHRDELNATEAAFLEASRQASADELERERQRSRRLRRRLYAAVIALIVAIGGIAVAGFALNRATSEADRANLNAARALGQQARTLAPQRPALAVAVAAEALARRDTPEIVAALHASHNAYVQAEWRTAVTLANHASSILGVAFSPDGDRIATAGFDGTARIWDAATGDELVTMAGESDELRGVVFSPNDARIATASNDGTATIWDAATGNELATLTGHDKSVVAVAFDPSSDRIATASADNTAKIWDATGNELTTLTGHGDTVAAVAFDPNSDRIATASFDGTARIWDAATGNELAILDGHTDAVRGVAFSPDGDRIVTASSDTTVTIWDAATGDDLTTLTGHTDQVRGVAFSPRGDRIVTGSFDGTAKIWDAATGNELTTLTGHTEQLRGLAIAPDGDRIVTGSFDGTAKIWDAATGNELMTLAGHGRPVVDVAFDPNGDRIATAGFDGTARIWDAATGKEVVQLTGHTDQVWGVVFSPDGDRIATASADNTARIWDAATGDDLTTLTGHDKTVAAVAFDAAGSRVATASFDRTAKIWDAETGDELTTLAGHTQLVRRVVFAPDGDRVATASRDGTAKIWDAETGEELATFTGHTDAVRDVAFAPDGGRIATASADNTAKIWDADTGDELTTLTSHDNRVSGVAFSPDGDRIATASADGTAVVRQLIQTPAAACELVALAVSALELETALAGDPPVACTALR